MDRRSGPDRRPGGASPGFTGSGRSERPSAASGRRSWSARSRTRWQRCRMHPARGDREVLRIAERRWGFRGRGAWVALASLLVIVAVAATIVALPTIVRGVAISKLQAATG